MTDLSSWLHLVLLYVWLVGALWVFYQWSILSSRMIKATSDFSNAFERLVQSSVETTNHLNRFVSSLPNLSTLLSDHDPMLHNSDEENPLFNDDEKIKTD